MNVEVEVEVLVVGAGVVLMVDLKVDLMVVPMVVLSEIKYERSSSFLAKSFLAKSFLAKILFCFDFVIWLPRYIDRKCRFHQPPSNFVIPQTIFELQRKTPEIPGVTQLNIYFLTSV